MRKNFTFLLASVCVFLSQPLLAQTNAFQLNGTNFITGQDPIFSTGGQAFTVEFWAYLPYTSYDGNFHEILGEGDVSDSASFYIGYDGSGIINIADTWGPTGVSMPFGVWTHFAVTYDGNYTNLYLNGILVFSNNNLGYGGSGDNLAIGTSADLSTPLFTGKIQNVAIYNTTARTQTQIKSDLFNTNPSDPTLTVFYSMNTPDGTTIDNSATSGNSELGVIHGDDGTNSYTTSPVQFSSNALTFDGIDDQVTIPANSAYDLSSNGGTIEFWVNPATVSTNFATVLGNRGPGQVEYSIHLSSTQVGLDVGSGVTAINLPDTFVTTNMWHHLAFVNTGTFTRVYINGVILDSIPGSFGSATGQSLIFGQSSGGPTNETAFNGSLDEVRIWNTQRSAAEIIDNMGNTLTGAETGLVGEFGFDEGVSAGNNTGLTTTIDNSTTNNNGTLQFFALSGTTSNFNLHTLSAVPLPLTLTQFTANRDDETSLLQWVTAQEQNTLDFVVERSTNGLIYTPIGTVEAAGNSTSARNYSFTDRSPQPNANYYRLKQTDIDGAFTYSPVCVVNFPTTNRQLIWYSIGAAAVEVAFSQGSSEPYSVLDASGRLLRSGQLVNGHTDISGLPAGIYFVRIMTNTGPLVTKIVL